MKKVPLLVGIILGSFVILGFFLPWVSLESAPYRSKGKLIEDSTKPNGWDLFTGKLEVKKINATTEKTLRRLILKTTEKNNPILIIIGGILLISGGLTSIFVKNDLIYILIISGGILAGTGGIWSYINLRWVRHQIIKIEDYKLVGYYSYGLLISTVSGFLSAFLSAVQRNLNRP